MKKLERWPAKLDAYCALHATVEFSYDLALGVDCCTFVFGAMHVQTGVDVGLPFAGTYRNRNESLLAMRNYCGHAKLEPAIEKVMRELGLQEIAIPFAQRGDPTLIRKGQRSSSLGIVALDGRSILTVSHRGICRVPRARGFRAWRIA